MTQISNRPATLDPEVMWEALVSHDRSYDGVFVCAVSSTGIYCRPTCPAKRPHRSRVSFYDLPEQARRDGFRACLRCHPDRPETDADLVASACRLIDRQIEDSESLPVIEDVCRGVGLSPSRLQRLFKLEMGLTPSQYARGRRLERFKALVKGGETVARCHIRRRVRVLQPPLRERRGSTGNDAGHLPKGRRGSDHPIRHDGFRAGRPAGGRHRDRHLFGKAGRRYAVPDCRTGTGVSRGHAGWNRP